jgi:hypothetical protein
MSCPIQKCHINTGLILNSYGVMDSSNLTIGVQVQAGMAIHKFPHLIRCDSVPEST